jgi:AhpD family alkylhydroperoxidase
VQYVVPVKPSKSKGLVSEVYSQIKEDFGRIVEPFTLHSPIPTLLAGVWMTSRESELVGIVPREIKEAVAASVSRLNKCPYCVDAHTIMIRATGEKKMAKFISQEQYEKISSHRTRKIVKWALATLSPNSKPIESPPFNSDEASEIIGTAVFYHYLNPLVSIFLGSSPIPIPFMKTSVKQIASHFFVKAVNRPKNLGTSLILLPDKKLPKDLFWAKDSPNIAGAYARFAGVMDDLEKIGVPMQTRETVHRYIDDWNPKASEFGLDCLKDATFKMEPQLRIATTIALLTVFAPFQITKETIHNFRRFFPQQRQLLGIIAWASFTKAVRIGKWLGSTAN